MLPLCLSDCYLLSLEQIWLSIYVYYTSFAQLPKQLRPSHEDGGAFCSRQLTQNRLRVPASTPLPQILFPQFAVFAAGS